MNVLFYGVCFGPRVASRVRSVNTSSWGGCRCRMCRGGTESVCRASGNEKNTDYELLNISKTFPYSLLLKYEEDV